MRRMGLFCICMIIVLASCASAPQPVALDKSKKPPEFNKIVLETIKQYPANGTHGYWWPQKGESDYDGGTKDIFLDGQKVMKGEPKKQTYCCGLTLEIFLESYKKWLKNNGGEKASMVTPEQWAHFKKLWFVEQVNGPGPSAALEAYQLGRTIELDEALPGDFVQIWRTVKEGKNKPTGHSVIFLNWVLDNTGKITGFQYWSTQPGTNGIAEREEFFGSDGGVNGAYTHFARVEPKAKKIEPVKETKPAKAEQPKKKSSKTSK